MFILEAIQENNHKMEVDLNESELSINNVCYITIVWPTGYYHGHGEK